MEIGGCDADWLLDALPAERRPATEDALSAAVHGWLTSSPHALRVVPSRGIAFAKSEDDVAADPPHPTRTRAQHERACGLHASWLLDPARAHFALAAPEEMGGVRCEGRVCCTPGMEFVSRRLLVADPPSAPEAPWTLRAYVEVAEGALLEERVAHHRRVVLDGLAAAPASCPDEPADEPR